MINIKENMVVKVLKNEYYKTEEDIPKQGSKLSSGYDIIAVSDPEIVGDIYSGTPNYYKMKTYREFAGDIYNGTPTYYSRIDYIQYHTGLYISISKQEQPSMTTFDDNNIYDTLIFPRSSISKYNLQLANSIGLCDSDYRGEILVRFNYIWQPQDFRIDELQTSRYPTIVGSPNMDRIYKKGDKIAQLKFSSVIFPKFSIVENLDITDRNDGGFGSTDLNKEAKSE